MLDFFGQACARWERSYRAGGYSKWSSGAIVRPEVAPRLESTFMRVLLTNDDGISAPGLQAARRALREIEGVEVDVIAPDSNRSATARSITTRSPLTVEEVEFGDGDSGFATDGTPVDCVRFAELGLVGHRPDLIVSGSTTAPTSATTSPTRDGRRRLRGDRPRHPGGGRLPTVLGRRHGLRQRPLRLLRGGALPRRAGRRLIERADARSDADQRQLPRRRTEGIEVTKLGKRIYNDELKLVGEDEVAAPPLRDLRLAARLRGDRGHRPQRGRPGADLGDADPLRPHRPRRAGELRGWGFEEMLAASSPSSV